MDGKHFQPGQGRWVIHNRSLRYEMGGGVGSGDLQGQGARIRGCQQREGRPGDRGHL